MEERNTNRKELELYLHIPFCIRKCDYCDFLSAPAQENIRQAYVEQMLQEIRLSSGQYGGFSVTTVFIGGGTPSILAPAQVQRLLEQIRACFSVSPDAEITIECNPGTLDADRLHVYQEAGVNRLSIGLQSADDRELRLLGRIHTYEQFAYNYSLARETGFDNINIDLMSALPGQSVRAYEHTLRKVLACKPEHISAYSLQIEEHTPFYARYGQALEQRRKGHAQHLLPSEDEERTMYMRTKELLKEAGYERYEISNYAKAGYACRHNIGYWTRKNYLGFGIGAASMVENIRFSNPADIKKYLEGGYFSNPGCASERTAETGFETGCKRTGQTEENRMGLCMPWHEKKEYLNKQAQMEEFMFLGLRMMCGVSSGRFYDRFAHSIEDIYADVVKKQVSEKLLRKTQTGYALTDYGIDVSNYVLAAYLLD